MQVPGLGTQHENRTDREGNFRAQGPIASKGPNDTLEGPVGVMKSPYEGPTASRKSSAVPKCISTEEEKTQHEMT